MCLLSSGYAFLASVLRTEYQFTRGTSSTGCYRHHRRFFFFFSASCSSRQLCRNMAAHSCRSLGDSSTMFAGREGISDIGTNKNCECFGSTFARPSINYARIRMLSDRSEVSIYFACDIDYSYIFQRTTTKHIVFLDSELFSFFFSFRLFH